MSRRLNRARCRLCGDIIVSRYRHDFVSCKCRAISIDGGNDYWRRCGDLKNILSYRNRKWVPDIEEKLTFFTMILNKIKIIGGLK